MTTRSSCSTPSSFTYPCTVLNAYAAVGALEASILEVKKYADRGVPRISLAICGLSRLCSKIDQMGRWKAPLVYATTY